MHIVAFQAEFKRKVLVEGDLTGASAVRIVASVYGGCCLLIRHSSTRDLRPKSSIKSLRMKLNFLTWRMCWWWGSLTAGFEGISQLSIFHSVAA